MKDQIQVNLEGRHNGIRYFIRDFPELKSQAIYCVTKLFYSGKTYNRYLHPTGWKLHTHYWNSPAEIIACLERNNFTVLPVTEKERQDHALIEDDIIRSFAEDSFGDWEYFNNWEENI